jgi:hypothetical protein
LSIDALGGAMASDQQNVSLPALPRYLPIALMSVAAVIAFVVLPTALRPPQDQQNTSAEFSPDAPPDEVPQEVILQSLRQASSSTAGGNPGLPATDEPPPPPPPPPQRKPSKGQCVSDRQTESLYSAPCVAAWQGDNGGQTYKYVLPNEIRIGTLVADDGSEGEGLVPDEPEANEDDVVMRLRVWQQYFNKKYETYGRQFRFYRIPLDDSGGTPEEGVAAIRKAAENQVFIVRGIHVNTAGIDEAIRQGMVVYGTLQNDEQYYRERFPHIFSFYMDGSKAIRLLDEMICKQLGTKPPSFNEQLDPLFDYNAPRKYGIIAYEDETRRWEEMTRAELRRCGIEVAEYHRFNWYTNESAMADAVVKMRSAGVTTIICLCDWASPIVFTSVADRNGYFPEWIHAGTGGTNLNGTARLYNHNTQWKHAVGIDFNEMPRPAGTYEWDRAWKEMAPDEDSPGVGDGGGALVYIDMTQIASGIQLAKEKLTPETFSAGLLALPHRPPSPKWSVGGGYAPGDYTYSDYADMTWWDPGGKDPNSSSAGAYQHLYGGQKFTHGQMPTEPAPFFQDGISTPPDPTARE